MSYVSQIYLPTLNKNLFFVFYYKIFRLLNQANLILITFV